jgi:hypothetical protein
MQLCRIHRHNCTTVRMNLRGAPAPGLFPSVVASSPRGALNGKDEAAGRSHSNSTRAAGQRRRDELGSMRPSRATSRGGQAGRGVYPVTPRRPLASSR